MTTNDIKLIQNNITNQLKGKPVAPLFISGVPGTGKSTTIRNLTEELNMNIVEYSVPCISLEFLSGLPENYGLPQFNSSQILPMTDNVFGTVWSMPELITNVVQAATSKPTVLLLDDFHALQPHMQSYFYQLLLEHRLGNYKLPSNVAIIGTMNDSDTAGFNGISSAIRNRMAILPLSFNFEYWFDNHGNRLHYMVASFLKAKPNYTIEEETTTITGFASARAWTAISADISSLEDSFIQSNALRIAGMQVSAEASQAFQAHVNYIQAIDFTEIVKQRQTVDLASKDPNDSIIYSYIANFIHSVEDGLYLFNFMNTNLNQNTFIGFLLGELYLKYTGEARLSDGLTFVIDKLLDNSLDESKYNNTSKAKLIKAFNKHIDNIPKHMELASHYLS